VALDPPWPTPAPHPAIAFVVTNQNRRVLEQNKASYPSCAPVPRMVLSRPQLMDETAMAIARFLLEDWPNTYCYLCLAIRLQVTETRVRDSLRPMVLLSHFLRVRHLRCSNCGRLGDLLQLGK
jgi:hypothetical protein